MDLKNLINQSKLDQYAAYLKSTSLSDASIKRKVSSLSSFQKFLVKKKLIEETSQTSAPIETNIVDNKKAEAKHFFDFSFLKKETFNTNKNFKDIWSNSFSRYSVIVLLILLLSGLGYGIYSQTILKANKNLAFSTASAPVRTGRFLSFQGRLTDSSGNPITSSTAIVFKLYNTQAVGTGTSLYTSSTGNSQTVVPDENGIFSVTIGQSHGTEIPASVFSENANVFLEITAGGETMSPRQPIATVAYALNSETLQGLPPSASGLKDTVMVIDSLGNINLGETSPSIVSTSGTMGIQGQALLLDATNSLANSNIRIDPTNSNGAIQLNTNGTGSSNAITASNSNLSTGNLFYGQIGNDNRGYNFLNFKNFDVGTSALNTRFYINGYGDTYVGRDLTVSNNAGVGGTLTIGNLDIGSSFLVSNLNADLLDGLHANGLPYVLNASNTTLTRSGVGSSASPYTLALNLGSTNTWTADTYFVGGRVGIGTTSPQSALDVSVYEPGDFESGSVTFNPTTEIGSTGTIQTWIVPHDGTYTLKAYGAEGGQGVPGVPGKGAYIQGDFVLSIGDTIKVLVGQKGQPHGVKGYGAGGGGGTFITKNTSTILLVAGGGGGSSTYSSVKNGVNASIGTSGTSGNSGYAGGTSGNGGLGSGGGWGGGGGAGYTGNGGAGYSNISVARSYINNGNGGKGYGGDGGFGGGGASGGGAGGGGGYSGGGGGYDYNAGGGGGSYNSGTNKIDIVGTKIGAGLASVEWQGVAKRAANFDGSVGIGIGATDPNYKLQVQGQSYLNGNVGIGTAPDNYYALNVNGKAHIGDDLVVDGSVSFNGNLTIGASLTVDSLTAKNVTSDNLNTSGITNLGSQGLGSGNNTNTGSSPVYIFTNDFQSMSSYNSSSPGGDIVTVNQGSNNVSIFVNNSNGSYGPRVNIPVGSSPVFGMNIDFNQDSYADIITVNSGSTSVSVLANMQIGGSVAFTRTDYAVGSYPVYATYNNFDNDSYGYYYDLAVANRSSSDISILPGNGSGYDTAVNIPVGYSPNFILNGEFNNNGSYNDLLVTNNDDGFISILSNNSIGDSVSFTRTDISTGYGPTHATIADVNRDSKNDIIVANMYDGSISVLTNDGIGNSASYTRTDYSCSGPKFVLAADLNNDSYVDIATANEQSNSISVFINNKDGTFASAVNYSSGGSYPQSITIQNLNNDSTWNDLIVVNSGSDSYFDPGNLSVFKNYNDGTFKAPIIYATTNSTGAKNIANTTYEFYDGYGSYYFNFLLVANRDSNNFTSFSKLSDVYGSTAFSVDGKGNIGIGTNAPKSKLQVVGGDVLFGMNATVTNSNLTDLGVEGNLNVGGSLSVNALSTFNLNNTGAFYNNGRVGIGTHSPVARLHVKSGFSPLKDLNTQITGSESNTGYKWAYTFTVDQNGTITQLGARGTNNSNKTVTLYNKDTGTSLASAVITTTGVTNWVFSNITPVTVTTGVNYAVVSQGSDGSYSYSTLTTPISFNGVNIVNATYGTGGSYSMYTTNSTMCGQADVTFIENAAVFEGNVGIGTTNPTHKLEVAGDALITSLNVGTTLITNNLFALGNVGIGNSSPIYKLDVNGEGVFTKLGIGGTSSIYNLLVSSLGIGVSGDSAFTNSVSIGESLTTTTITATNAGSTAVVTNLNADLWDGYQFSSYFNQQLLTTSSPLFAGLTISSGGIGVSGNSTFSKNLTVGGTLTLSNTNVNVGVSTALFVDSNNNVYKRTLGDLAFQDSLDLGWVAKASSTQFVGVGTTFSLTGTNGLTTTSVGSSQITFGLGGTLNSNTKINTSSYELAFFGLGGTASISIESNGFIGIGTTAPRSKLDVWGGQFELTGAGVNGTLVLDTVGGKSLIGTNTNTNGITIDSSGQIGIGNTTPAYKLDVNGNLGVASTAYFASLVGIGNASPKWTADITVPGSTSGTGLNIRTNVGGDATGYLRFTNTTNNDSSGAYSSFIGGERNSVKGHSLVFGTASVGGVPTERMRLSNIGNLGIGTTNPLYKLEVTGDALITTRLGIGNTNPLYALNISGTGGLGVGGTAFFNSLVGIGTSTPTENLHIYNASSATQSIQDANSVLRFVATGGINYIQSGALLNSDSKADLQFTAIYGSSPRMTIKGANGNIGINTTNPFYKLEVTGDALITTRLGVGVTNANYSIYTNGKLGVGSSAFFGSLVGIGISNPTQALTIGVGTSINITGNANGELSAQYFTDIKSPAYRLVPGNVQPEKNSLGLTSTGSIKFNVGDTSLSNMFYINNGAASRIQNFSNGLLLDVGTGSTTAGTAITWGSQLFLSSNGSIGVGKTNPNALYKMDIGGTLNVQDIFQNGQQISMGNWNLNGTNIYNTNLGTVGIGTSTFSGSYKLKIVGDVSLNGMLNMNNNYISNGYQPGDSSFLGYFAGYNAVNAYGSNFFGSNAGQDGTDAYYSNFLGVEAGYGSYNAHDSNFLGYEAGYYAVGAYNSNLFGNMAGYNATDAYNSNFLGNLAGNNAANAHNSNFLGLSAGDSATNAYNSNFLGLNAGQLAIDAYNSNFFGTNSGVGASNAHNSNFFGTNSGIGASNANYSNFLGHHAGDSATNSTNSNFLGNYAGRNATDAGFSNFLGSNAGDGALYANNSNFLGSAAGYGAENASFSNFLGYFAGYGALNASDSLFLGSYAGYNDSVNNIGTSGTSIAIGRYSGTGGYSNSIAIGHGVVNSTSSEINLGNVLYLSGIYGSDTQSSAAVSNGRVGIGTTSPRFEAEINGNLYVSSSNIGTSLVSAESFTGGAFPPTNFTLGAGNSGFVRDTVTFYDTDASAESNPGNDGIHYSNSWMETTVTMPSDGDLSYWWKVSSESSWDYLYVCIDRSTCNRTENTQRIAGEHDWAKVIIPISAGSHTVRWGYAKDGSVNTGSDRGWIDDIMFNTYVNSLGNIYTDGSIGIGTTKTAAPLHVVTPDVSTECLKNVEIVPNGTGRIGYTQVWTAPRTGNYTIDAYGAGGGSATSYTSYPGLGAKISGTVNLNIGETLIIMVGQRGGNGTNSGGGGGGTFVVKLSGTQPVIVAGGGGGAYQSSDYRSTVSNASITTSAPNNTYNDNSTGGGGGGGFLTNGLGGSSYINYGYSFVNGGIGGTGYTASSSGNGGYGGGAGGEWSNHGSAGGGGGYSGGGGGTNGSGGNGGYYAVGGGASYNIGSSQTNTAGVNSTDGRVTISYMDSCVIKSTAAIFEGNIGVGTTKPLAALHVNPSYDTSNCTKNDKFNATSTGQSGSTQVWTAPTSGTYIIDAYGASGGTGYNYAGGLGAQMKGTYVLNIGDTLIFLVGQRGGDGTSGGGYNGGGGGGGTFVVKKSVGTTTLIVAAGGGGGGGRYDNSVTKHGSTSTSGQNGYYYGVGGINGNGGTGSYYAGGGAGWLSNGGNGVNSNPPTGGSNFPNGIGGTGYAGFGNGGYGGGGGSYYNAGGGGGYSGGGGGAYSSSYTTRAGSGGGGGSYSILSNQTNNAGANTGNGQIIITYQDTCIIKNTAAIFEGNIGVNNTNPEFALDIMSIGASTVARFRNSNSSSSCAINSNGTLTCSSDARLKKNIDDLNYGLNTLSQLRAIDFNWNTDSDSASKSLGFIAQEVEQILPELVVTNADGYKELNTIGMVPIIVKSVQEQQAEILALSQDLNITETGQININMNISDDVLKTLGYSDTKNEIEAADYSIVDNLGNQVNRIAQFGQIAVAKIQTGLLSATNVVTKNMVTENLVSPKANIDELTALNIQSTQITTTDLKAETATVSSLYADNIITKQGSITDVMAQKIADLRDELKQFVASAGTTQADTPLMAQASDWDTSVASGSAKLAGDLTLSGDMVIGSKLTVNGDTQLGNAFITGTLSTGQIAIKDNFIETTNSALYLQPSATGSVHILGDTLIVADTGDVIINGNLNLNGTLTAQNASINGSLIANMIQAETASFDSLSTNQIKIATDSAQVIIAESGFAALATSSAELTSNATAGTVNLPLGKTELIISNNKLTPDSMVYLTPNGSTQNQVVYVKQKTIDSFTIAIDQPLDNDVAINWWIIN